ncbi:MAG: short-chain dehydrogenase [Chloroflexota bacterium]|nr:MAG: short-chain dehydrogenase [Chloroflexota bacterium]
MDLGLRDKVALVAASSKGLGRASALALAREGAKVAICARNGKMLKVTADEIATATGSELLAIPADMTNSRDIEQVVKETVKHFGKLHILVTNAGGPPAGDFGDFDDKQWQEAFNLTLMSAVRLIRAALPPMQKERWGRIINITSTSVKEPLDNLVLSNSIRAAVHGLAKTLANQLGPYRITVNNVMPGTIHTDRIEQLARTRAQKSEQTVTEAIAAMGQAAALGRVGEPEEFGAVVAFLASEHASYITGVSLPVDGGKIQGTF